MCQRNLAVPIERPSSLSVRSWRPLNGLAIILLTISLWVGCDRGSISQPSGETIKNGLTRQQEARELLNEIKMAYAQATQYHDDAKIIVRYQLEGRPMEEHQLWAVDFQRPSQLAARLFNARIQSDNRRTTTMVFDFDSENMDSQFLVLDSSQGTPWTEMFGDPVCRHFISGSTEIPFNARLADEFLLPPTIGLLAGQPAIDWLDHPDEIELLADGQLDGQTVRRIRVALDRHSFELWIDPATKLLLQAILPVSYLDDALLTAPEIANLQLSVRFNEATFQPKWSDTPFSTDLPDVANPVSHFVPLPEPFPSEFVGKKIPALSLSDAAGKAERWSTPGKATVLAWVDRQDSSRELVRLLEELVSNDADSSLGVQLCYVEFRDPNLNPPAPSDLPQFVHEMRTPFSIRADVGLAAGAPLGVKFAPTALVLDAAGALQFFYAIGANDWKSKLTAAIERVQKGENVAGEMRAEYSKFIDDYKTNLRRFNPLAQASDAPTTNVATHPEKIEAARTPIWSTGELKLPGNILLKGDEHLLINDGWQSVAEMDLATKNIRQHSLELDPDTSVTTLRALRSGSGDRFAAFAEMGRQVLVLDADWRTVGKRSNGDQSQFRDVQFATGKEDEAPEVWILDSDGRLIGYDERLETKRGEIQVESADSFIVVVPPSRNQTESVLGDDSAGIRFLIVRADGGLVAVDDHLKSQPPFTFGSLKVKQLRESPSSELLACATALGDRGEWVAVGIDRNLGVAWTKPIGSQEHERQIQAVAAEELESGGTLWAFAASDRTVTIISGDGREVDSFHWSEPIHGIAWARHNDIPAVVISDPSKVSICSLKSTK